MKKLFTIALLGWSSSFSLSAQTNTLVSQLPVTNTAVGSNQMILQAWNAGKGSNQTSLIAVSNLANSAAFTNTFISSGSNGIGTNTILTNALNIGVTNFFLPANPADSGTGSWLFTNGHWMSPSDNIFSLNINATHGGGGNNSELQWTANQFAFTPRSGGWLQFGVSTNTRDSIVMQRSEEPGHSDDNNFLGQSHMLSFAFGGAASGVKVGGIWQIFATNINSTTGESTLDIYVPKSADFSYNNGDVGPRGFRFHTNGTLELTNIITAANNSNFIGGWNIGTGSGFTSPGLRDTPGNNTVVYPGTGDRMIFENTAQSIIWSIWTTAGGFEQVTGPINADHGYQISGSYGSAGQVLTSTGTGTAWSNNAAIFVPSVATLTIAPTNLGAGTNFDCLSSYMGYRLTTNTSLAFQLTNEQPGNVYTLKLGNVGATPPAQITITASTGRQNIYTGGQATFGPSTNATTKIVIECFDNGTNLITFLDNYK